jgi:hypothetical protein
MQDEEDADAHNDRDETTDDGGEPVELTEDEKEELVEAESTAEPVSYSGQDFDVSGLVRRLTNDDILIPIFGHEDDRISSAGFQRSFVWSRKQMDRFIESLLLGYPIPGILLVRQADRRYLVLDGQQRLRTLRFFYDGVYAGKEFGLSNVAERFKGLTYKSLPEDQRRLLDDTFIQATIVATDGSTESLEAIYQIFERLNAGGTPLTPHEIRVALFAGPFIDFLERLNRNVDWRTLYGRPSPRLRDQELILRIIALYLSASNYRRPLKTFLNQFTAAHRVLDLDDDRLHGQFATASDLLAAGVGREALRLQSNQINAALTEAIFVGLLHRLDGGQTVDQQRLTQAIGAIRADSAVLGAVARATADEESVRSRLTVATSTLAGV